jgi:hypothetical protein
MTSDIVQAEFALIHLPIILSSMALCFYLMVIFVEVRSKLKHKVQHHDGKKDGKVAFTSAVYRMEFLVLAMSTSPCLP